MTTKFNNFRYLPIEHPHNLKIQTRVTHKVVDVPTERLSQRIVAASFLGSLSVVAWESSEMGVEMIKKEYIKLADKYAVIHDGPILYVDRNTFVPELFLAIGGNVLALWKFDLLWTPIFWRRCLAKLTACKWSKDRPSVFFLARDDGSFEAWDLLSILFFLKLFFLPIISMFSSN